MSVELMVYPTPARDVVGRILEQDASGNSVSTDKPVEAVLVLPVQGKVKVLNEVGARIWSLANGQRTVGEIAEMICREYAVELSQAQADTLLFLNDLAASGALSLEAEAAA